MQFILEGFQLKERGKKQAGAYKLTHVPTRKFYFGSTGDIYNRFKVHWGELRRGTHNNKRLQALYIESPHFHLHFFLTGDGPSDEDVREKAYDIEQKLLDEHWGSDLLLNDCPDARIPFAPNVIKAMWEDPDKRAEMTEINRRLRQTESARQRQSEISKRHWSDPVLREKILAAKHSEEALKKAQESHKANWADPAYKTKMTEIRNSPEYLEKARQAKKDKMRAVSIDGVQYESILGAVRVLGMRRQTIRDRCKSEKFPNYFYTLTPSSV